MFLQFVLQNFINFSDKFLLQNFLKLSNKCFFEILKMCENFLEFIKNSVKIF